ncbi:MAG: class I SAM-dependent methyltransferase [Thermoplasmata archaeon]
MNSTLVGRLGLIGTERVLEIGFGPGVALPMLQRALPRGKVFGIDPSAVMFGQALRRLERASIEAEVDLRLGSAARLPWPGSFFDDVLSANNIQLWDPLETSLAEVARVLKPGGLLLIGVHEWAARGQGGALGRSLEELRSNLTVELSTHGWALVTPETVPARIGQFLSVSARWP